MRVYLVGYMASGKSKTGRTLADDLDYDFLDLDEMFEERYHVSIPDFFHKYGEENFRPIERQLLHSTSGFDNTVIATGGGTPCFFDNMDFILHHGISVYLYWKAAILAKRLNQVRKKRPVIGEMKGRELEYYVQKHLEDREKFYLKADFFMDMEKDELTSLVYRIKNQAFGLNLSF